MQLLLFLVSVETQERPATELMLNNELGVYMCVYIYKGLWGKLKCQRGSVYDTSRGIGIRCDALTKRMKNRQTIKSDLIKTDT